MLAAANNVIPQTIVEIIAPSIITHGKPRG
jgi:hypothetical protein